MVATAGINAYGDGSSGSCCKRCMVAADGGVAGTTAFSFFVRRSRKRNLMIVNARLSSKKMLDARIVAGDKFVRWLDQGIVSRADTSWKYIEALYDAVRGHR